MSGPVGYGGWVLSGLVLCAALLLLRRPIGLLLRLCLRSGAGLATLALLSPIWDALGLSLGINLVNALVLGLLGVPGFGLLIMLQWLLR